MGLALESVGLAKHFGALRAVDGVSFSVEEGSVYGFVGPNGAGKTTTIRMILGLMRPTAGTARIFGRDVRSEWKLAIRAVGAMVEGPAFYPFLSARANLRLFGRLSGGIPGRRIDEVLEQVGLSRRRRDKVAAYSQGMRQRLGIALALLERPRLLVLDEPTNGLDPQGTREVRELLRGVRDAGETTVFLSSHLLAELEQICDRVAILSDGRVLREGPLDELRDGGSGVLEIRLPVEQEEGATARLAEVHGLSARRVRPGRLEVSRDALDVAALNRDLVESGFRVSGLAVRRPTLEEVFVALTGEGAEVR